MKKLYFLLVNVVLAALLIWGIAAFVLGRLDDYTEHGIVVPVPQFRGMSLEQAGQVAEDVQLRIMIRDSVYTTAAAPGTVIDQYPADSVPVKRNRLVHLTVNAIAPEPVAVPNLRNAAYRQTVQTLIQRGFMIGRLEYQPSEFRHLVLDLKQDGKIIEPGTMLAKGSVIDLVLGSGKGENSVRMPELFGKSLKEATEILRRSYLNLGKIVVDGSIRNQADSLGATVFQHSCDSVGTVEAGSYIDLSLTLDREKLSMLDSLRRLKPEDLLMEADTLSGAIRYRNSNQNR